MNYAVTCSCGKYQTAYEMGIETAKYAAEMHVLLGPNHVCTISKRMYNFETGKVTYKEVVTISAK